MTKFRRTASSNLKMKQMLLILSSFTLLNISKCMKMTNGNIPKSLRVGHQNLGSGIVSNKLSDIDYLLMEYKPHILGVSETTLDIAAENALNNDGYVVETKDDNERIAVIVKGNVKYKRRRDLETPFQPVIWIELGTGANRVLWSHIYREWQLPAHRKGTTQYNSRSTVDQLERWKLFLEDWERALDEGVEVHVQGDLNIDTGHWKQLGKKSNPEVQELVDELYETILSRGVTQTVTEPTRTGNTGGGICFSTLDLHFTNELEKIKSVCVEMLG